MRKLIVGLMAVGLLAMAGPAMAADNGLGDPLGLIASGAVLPYVGSPASGGIFPGSQSFLEVTSPVGPNGNFHMFFFDVSCVKQPRSIGLPLTTNDLEILRIDNADPANASDGLITAAGTNASGQNLLPLNNPVHARVYWVTGQGFVRIFTPISLDHGEFPGQILTWNPLRTGVSFFAPLDSSVVHTTLLLVCPNAAIAHAPTSVFPPPTFPDLVPNPQAAGKAQSLQGRVYDDEERFLRNFLTSCNCLTSTNVTSLDAVYADAVSAPFGTYTELETVPPPDGPHAFTGFRAIHVGGASGTSNAFDVFGRLDNANVDSQQGNLNRNFQSNR
jgi:hypothetical protein